MGLTVYPEVLNRYDFSTEVALGNVDGWSIMSAMGERDGIGTTVTGEDIWRGTATTVPTPPDIGEQMSVISTDAADTSAGIGVNTIEIHYLDAAGDEQIETAIMNGTTAVDFVATDIRFVNDLYALTVGTNGVAAGTISVYKTGAASTIYNMIHIGGNKSLVPHRMVPRAKSLILKRWHLTEAQGKRVNFRIRSTDMHGVILPGVFCFKDVEYLKASTSGMLELDVLIPSLSIVKVSGWAVLSGAEGSCGWWGYLVDD
jgi:hypothetical protein